MTYTFDERIVSDLHKDTYGYRPSQCWWDRWDLFSNDQKQAMWDAMSQDLSEELDRERQAEARAAFALTERLEKMYELGAKDEVQALKWIMEAEEFSSNDLEYGPDYFCYRFGISYGAKSEFSIQQAINEMLAEVE